MIHNKCNFAIECKIVENEKAYPQEYHRQQEGKRRSLILILEVVA
jgi:hypothetical protein